MARALIRHLANHLGETVTLHGWVVGCHTQEDGTGAILGWVRLRDGSGTVDARLRREGAPEELWEDFERLTIDSVLRVTGIARPREADGTSGVEIELTDLILKQLATAAPKVSELKRVSGEDRPGAAPHLAIRREPQRSILRLRSEIQQALGSFLHGREFTLVDVPILRPSSLGGAIPWPGSDDGPGDGPCLANAAQLPLEAACAALGRVYSLGPTFEVSTAGETPRWVERRTLEVEVAFWELEELQELVRALVIDLLARVEQASVSEWASLGKALPSLSAGLPHLTYDEARAALARHGSEPADGAPLDDAHRALLAADFDGPFFISRHPAVQWPVHYQPDPENSQRALSLEFVLPGGSVLVRGGQRTPDARLLERRLTDRGESLDLWRPVLDLRRRGGFTASGFSLVIEELVAWLADIPAGAAGLVLPTPEEAP